METDIAQLKATVSVLDRQVGDQWDMLRKISENEKNDQLILYKLEELTKKLDSHDRAEIVRTKAHEERLTSLEQRYNEFQGAFKALTTGAGLLGSLVGGVIVLVAQKWLAVWK